MRTGSQQLQWFRFRKGRKQRLLNQVGISGLLETCTTPNLKTVFSVLINFSSSASSVFLDHDTWPDFPSAWGWADNDHIFIFGCTYPFRYKNYVFLKGSILCWRESNVVWIYIFSDCIFLLPCCTDILFPNSYWMWFIVQTYSVKCKVMHLEHRTTMAAETNSVNKKTDPCGIFSCQRLLWFVSTPWLLDACLKMNR